MEVLGSVKECPGVDIDHYFTPKNYPQRHRGSSQTSSPSSRHAAKSQPSLCVLPGMDPVAVRNRKMMRMRVHAWTK